MLSPLLFTIVVDVIIENAREDLTNEISYTDDLVFASETTKDLQKKRNKG